MMTAAQLWAAEYAAGSVASEGPECHAKKHEISFLLCLRSNEESVKGE